MEEDGGRKDGYGNAVISPGHIFRANSTPNGIDCKEDDAEFKSESAQYSIPIEDRDTTSQHNNIMLESDDSFGAENGLSSLYDPVAISRGISYSTVTILTDRTDLCDNISADEAEIIF
jgi:hypothetical protein